VDDERRRQELVRHRDAACERAALMAAELERFVAASVDSNADDEHDPEGSTIAFERAQLAALLDQAHQQVRDAQDALGRLAAHEYGRCEQCGNPIGVDRLEARPTARRCIACAARPAG
jgi:DnaK suppressor protein